MIKIHKALFILAVILLIPLSASCGSNVKPSLPAINDAPYIVTCKDKDKVLPGNNPYYWYYTKEYTIDNGILTLNEWYQLSNDGDYQLTDKPLTINKDKWVSVEPRKE